MRVAGQSREAFDRTDVGLRGTIERGLVEEVAVRNVDPFVGRGCSFPDVDQCARDIDEAGTLLSSFAPLYSIRSK